jgi:presenilin 1
LKQQSHALAAVLWHKDCGLLLLCLLGRCPQVVGILALFFLPVPLLLKQCYTVWVGICVAYIFTHVPEWTSWVLLVIMALYDLAAVLLPGGPLKVGERCWGTGVVGHWWLHV